MMISVWGNHKETSFFLVVLFVWPELAHSLNRLITTNKCRTGWIKADSSCYQWNNIDLVTWYEAQMECQLKGAHLLTVNDKADELWISAQTKLYSTDGWWIGLYRDMHRTSFDHTPTWRWVNHSLTDINLVKWDKEPDTASFEDCVTVNEEAKWANEQCTNKYGYICKYQISRTERCPPDWVAYDVYCYYISDGRNASARLNWHNASNACKVIQPGKTVNLLSVMSPDEQNFLKNELPTDSTAMVQWWTGLNDLAAMGVYRWIGGRYENFELSDLKWDSSPSKDLKSKQNCALMSYGGKVNDDKCLRRAYYICETPAVTSQLDVGCDSWVRGGQSCYLFGTAKGYTRDDARRKCQSVNADLLKVDDLDEKSWFEHMPIGGVGYWTGLTDQSHESVWSWADGSKADMALVTWNQEPNDYMNDEDCAEILRDGVYNDISCNNKLGFICEYNKQRGTPCFPGWIARDDIGCYYISNTVNQSYFQSWFEAGAKCNDLVQESSGQLEYQAFRLAVNDKGERDWIKGQLAKTLKSATGWWTGLNDRSLKGVWTYVDNFNNPPDMTVITWAGEPNNKNGKENCAVMYEGGRYNDLDCNAKAYFICEKRARALVGAGNQPEECIFLIFSVLVMCLELFKFN